MLHYFGTDGVRGQAGTQLTEEMAYRIGRFIGQYPDGKGNFLLLARDTRESGPALASALIKGATESGATIYDEGVSTTPSISYLVRGHDFFSYGIMISASHNPYGDNGIKIFNAEGEKLSDDIEELIEGYMDWKEDDLPHKEGHLVSGSSLKEEYIEWLASKARPEIRGLKVLVDCANGSASSIAPELYKKLGLESHFIHAEPNGKNINDHCGSTHLESLKETFSKGGYDLGFAFDGDADRFMAFGPDGRLIDGDAQIFLQALEFKKQRMLNDNKVVITVMSNYGLIKALRRRGIGYDVVAVGDKNVQADMKDKNLYIGGEQSGHVIFLQDLNTGDGLLSSIKLMNLFVLDRPTFDIVKEFKVYPQVLINIAIPNKELVAKLLDLPALKEEEAAIEKELGDTGRILVRASGTEPLIRVMVEADKPEVTEQAADRLASVIKRNI